METCAEINQQKEYESQYLIYQQTLTNWHGVSGMEN